MGAIKTLAIGIALLSVVMAESVGSEKSLLREKRQIPVQTLPTFPPDVERTADGVPILDESYLDRADRPAARFFAQFEPTTESEGLRLYEGLWATGGRNEPRSLDHSDPFGENGIQPHHRQSAAWSSRKETKRFSSSRSGKRIQVRSGGSDQEDLPVPLLPSGFGPSTGPKFSEEVTYRRSTGGNSNSGGNLQTRSLTSTSRDGENGFSCVTCRRSSSTAGTTGASSSHQLRSLGHASEEVSGAHAETEGLRLYNKWLSESQSRQAGSGAGLSSRRNRNQLRNLDNGADDLLASTTNTNGENSASSSWTKREERRHSSRRSSKTITVRSGGSADNVVPAPVLPTTAPKFSEEVTYRRNAGGSSSSGNSGTQTRSLISTSRNNNNNGESGFSCVTCRRSSASNLASTTGSRNEARSLDLHQAETVGQRETFPAPSPNVQTHHSESWAENEERRHHNSRSSSSSSVPVNGGEVRVTDLENRADINPTADQSEEVTYRRASSGSHGSGGCAISNNNGANSHSSTSSTTNNGSYRRTNCTRIASNSRTNGQSNVAETRSLSAASGNDASSSGCRRCSTQTSSSSLRSSDNEGSSSSSSFRSSRVPSSISSRPTTRALDYPPVQTFGQGDGQVAARVLHSDDDSELTHHASASENGENSQSASSASTGKKFRKAYYRRTVFKNYTTSSLPASAETWLGAA